MAHTALLIERLLQFSLQHSLIGELDAYVARNTLLDLFGLSEPWADGVPEEHLDVPTVLLDALLDDAAARGLYDGEVPALRVNFEARIMGAVMPRESETAARFEQLRQTQGVRAATDYFYGLCIASNYIRTAQIAKTSNGTIPANTAGWRSPSTSQNRKRIPRPSLWSACSRQPAIPNVCCASRTSAMRAA